MKKLSVLMLMLVLCFCGCTEGKGIPPEITVAKNIKHNSNTEFEISKYCSVENYTDDVIKLTYEGEVNTEKTGDYPITVTAVDKNKNKTSCDVVVTVQKNRTSYSPETICRELKDYIFNLQRNGYQNIGYLGYAEGFGFIAEAVTVNNGFTYNDFKGNMYFEAYQMESEKTCSFNFIFSISDEAMWYYPKKVEFSAGDKKLEFNTTDEFSPEGQTGFYVTLDEMSGVGIKEVPDYAYIEKLKEISKYNGAVKMKAYGASDSFELELTDAQKKDFHDILMVYEEMLSYY